MKYSYKGQIPQDLPESIMLSDHRTRTDKTTFTEEELIEAGYTATPDISYDSNIEILEWRESSWTTRPYTEQEIQAKKDTQISIYRNRRDPLINSIMWRVQRYESEVRQGLHPTDDIIKLDTYIQALRDITKHENITWPINPFDNIPTL